MCPHTSLTLSLSLSTILHTLGQIDIGYFDPCLLLIRTHHILCGVPHSLHKHIGYRTHIAQPSQTLARIRLFIGHYVLSAGGDIFATSFINPMRSIYATELLYTTCQIHTIIILSIRFYGSACVCECAVCTVGRTCS